MLAEPKPHLIYRELKVMKNVKAFARIYGAQNRKRLKDDELFHGMRVRKETMNKPSFHFPLLFNAL